MSIELIEQKLAEIERRLAAVETRTVASPQRPQANPAWRELIGWSKDDDLLRAAARSGAEWREQMNREGK